MNEFIVSEIEGCISTVTINSPSKHNALCLSAWKCLSSEILKLNNNNNLRCIIIRGAGERAFSAGADISRFQVERSNAKQAMEYGYYVAKSLENLINCEIPLIAMISGVCAGGGLEIASCCDIRISSETAKFGIPINRIGHAFSPQEMKPVIRLLGLSTLLELVLEGRMWTAEEALSRGLINRMVPLEKLVEETQKTATNISSGAPLAARMTKRMLRLLSSKGTVSQNDLKLCYSLCDTNDYKAGVTAFLAKDKPKFNGN